MNRHILANQIVELVGGKENISNVFHCMTRLRFNLKDAGLADDEKIKALDGVLGINNPAGELQIIVGAGVESIYKEVIAIVGLDETKAIEENLDPTLTKRKFSFKKLGGSIFNVFSACMNPLVPLFVLTGVFNMIAVLIGPQFFGWVTVESDLYNNFYFVAQTVLYFLPVLVGYTAAKRFGANPLITIVLAACLLYPGYTTLVDAGTAYTVFGINAPLVSYSTSVFPIIMIAGVQSLIEKALNKYVPDAVKVILVPCGTVLIMLPMAFCVLGPIGTWIGTGLGKLIFALYDFAGPAATTLIGAIAVFGVALGFTRPISFIALSGLFANGVDFVVMPNSMVLLNWVVMGAILGYTIKTKSAKNRQLGITCFASNFLGGVSEPSIFGVLFNNRRLLIATTIGGALAGLYSGIMKVGYYAFGPSNFLNVIGFMGDNRGNFVHGCIAAGVGFISSLVISLIVYTDERKTA